MIENDVDVTEPKTLSAETVKVDTPVVVGVPDSTPLDVFSDNPAGNDPDATANVAAGYPDALNVYEYALPTTPVDAGLSAMNTGTDPTVIDNDPELTDPDVFVADTANVNTPDVVGVPDNTPLDVFNDNPVGNDPDANANVGAGNPEAAKVKLNGIEIVAVDGGPSAVNTGAVSTAMVIDPDDTEPAALVAMTLKVKVPVAVGVPDRTPVEPLSDKPVGNDPADTENVGAGEPDAVNVYE